MNDATGLLKADRMALRASLPRSTVFTGTSRPPGSGASRMGGVESHPIALCLRSCLML